jgi:hypothetical protein
MHNLCSRYSGAQRPELRQISSTAQSLVAVSEPRRSSVSALHGTDNADTGKNAIQRDPLGQLEDVHPSMVQYPPGDAVSHNLSPLDEQSEFTLQLSPISLSHPRAPKAVNSRRTTIKKLFPFTIYYLK